MAARKLLTRAESQAQTRQTLLESAEQMFYAKGYHTTSIAAIAAEAGRTIGAVYSNFDSKEALCLEVLRARFMSELTKLMEAFVSAGTSLDARLEALSQWCSRLATETQLVVLAAEYMTSTWRDADQIAASREVIERFKESTRVLLEDMLPDDVLPTDQGLDDAINGVVATGTGMAIGQAIGIYEGTQGVDLMVATLRMWFDRLSEAARATAG